MGTKTMYIVTGIAAFAGGLITAVAGLSCDVETCEGEPQPSAIVRMWAPRGSVRVPVVADSVEYQVLAEGGSRRGDMATPPAPPAEGKCLDPGCTQWAVGSDQPGRVVVTARACGKTYTAEAVVELDDEACHADTQTIDIDVDPDTCAINPERLPPYECEPLAHPSVHVMVARRYDDYFASAKVDMVWFEHEGRTHEARCMQDGNGDCSAWIAGYELEGPITVSTEYCDTMVSRTVTVQPLPNSCHVQTEYVMLEVDTRGCLTGEDQASPPPPPRPPWDLTAVLEHDRPDGPGSMTTPNRFPPPPPPGPVRER